MNTKKAQLGQFMTKNNEYILQGMKLPDFKGKFIEPFAGNGDLVDFLISHKISKNRINCYDIEPKNNYIEYRDSLMNPIDYSGHFVITNPPYLARNKSKEKTIFDRYGLNDLYKCFIQQLIDCPPVGGIIIIPLNFWSSIRIMDVHLRARFLDRFSISRLNIFEEQVFKDTSYTICSFQFTLQSSQARNIVSAYFFPSKHHLDFELNQENQYTFGGEIYNLPINPSVSITRLTRINQEESKLYVSGIIVKCIDDGIDETNWIRLWYSEDEKEIEKFTDFTKDLTFRSYAVLVIKPKLSPEQQKQLVNDFNLFLNSKRKTTRSLFLANFRDKYRKRISFDLVYRIISHLLI
jgi:hypothetical protein